jgi:hypothetical protein
MTAEGRGWHKDVRVVGGVLTIGGYDSSAAGQTLYAMDKDYTLGAEGVVDEAASAWEVYQEVCVVDVFDGDAHVGYARRWYL